MQYYKLPYNLDILISTDAALAAVPILYLAYVYVARSSAMAAEKKNIPATPYPKIVSMAYNLFQVKLKKKKKKCEPGSSLGGIELLYGLWNFWARRIQFSISFWYQYPMERSIRVFWLCSLPFQNGRFY